MYDEFVANDDDDDEEDERRSTTSMRWWGVTSRSDRVGLFEPTSAPRYT